MIEKEMHYREYKNNYSWCKTVPNSYNSQTKFIKVLVDEKEEYRRYKLKFDEGIKNYIRNANERELDLDTVYAILKKNIRDSKLSEPDKEKYLKSLEENYQNVKGDRK
jgi:hypothetical protein